MNQKKVMNLFTKNIEVGINMITEFKTYDNTILVIGKKYRWSGHIYQLYNSFAWDKNLCKIRKIENDKIFIYDYSENKEYEYNNINLEENKIIFKKTLFGIL